MIIANQNFVFDGREIKRGDQVPDAQPYHFKQGFVREVKIIKPEVRDAEPTTVIHR